MNETNAQEALAGLKVGDTAYVQSRYSIWKVTITKVTSTQFVDSDGKRYYRKDGKSVEKTDRWSQRDQLLLSTPDVISQYQRRINLALIGRQDWRELDNETLAAVAALLRKGE